VLKSTAFLLYCFLIVIFSCGYLLVSKLGKNETGSNSLAGYVSDVSPNLELSPIVSEINLSPQPKDNLPPTIIDELPIGTPINQDPTLIFTPTLPPSVPQLIMMKDVGEPFLDYFGLTEKDFGIIADAGVNLIESPIDICASDEDVQYLLDQSLTHHLRVILPAGAGEAEWGYECDAPLYPSNQQPIWQKIAVGGWVNKWKSHPAVYGWDISNEAGLNFPNGGEEDGFFLTVAQIRQAYADVKSFDPTRPIVIRMMGWDFYEHSQNPFGEQNPYSKNMADIVMINAYSNVEDYYEDFVPLVTERAISSLRTVTPNVKICIALGVWEELPLWHKPALSNLEQDIQSLNKFNQDIYIRAFFKYGAAGGDWYLPSPNKGYPEVLSLLSQRTIL